MDKEGKAYEQFFCPVCRREKVTELALPCPGPAADDQVVVQDDQDDNQALG